VIYKLIGMAVVKLGLRILRRKAVANKVLLSGVAGAAALTVVAAAGYLATRDAPEA